MPHWSSLKDWEMVWSNAEAIATIAALILAGVWTYLLFIQNRKGHPRAEVTHKIFIRKLTSEYSLLHVQATLINKGDVLLPIEKVHTTVQCISPPPQQLVQALQDGDDPLLEGRQEYPWPSLGERSWEYAPGTVEIEPGEHHPFTSDFFIEANTQCLSIYTYVWNCTKKPKEIGWDQTTICDPCETVKGVTMAEDKTSSGDTNPVIDRQGPPKEISPPSGSPPTSEISQSPPSGGKDD